MYFLDFTIPMKASVPQVSLEPRTLWLLVLHFTSVPHRTPGSTGWEIKTKFPVMKEKKSSLPCFEAFTAQNVSMWQSVLIRDQPQNFV